MIDPKTIWSSANLPTLPSVAIQLLDISKNPETEIKEVIDVIKSDPAIAAKIIKASNSSFFGFTSRVPSLERAVPLLGTTVVSSLALSFSLVDDAMTRGPMAEYYNKYWMQSLVQGVSSELLGEHSNEGLNCEFFLSGLLIDLGRLAMLKTIPEESARVLQQADEESKLLFQLEDEHLGFNHVEIGVRLMESWGLPTALIDSVASHHASKEQIKNQNLTPNYDLIKATATSAAVGGYFCTENKGVYLEHLRDLTAEFYGFDDEKLEQFLDQTRQRTDSAGELFQVNTEDIGSPGDLMIQANQQLAEIAVREAIATTQAVARQEAMQREQEELKSQNDQLQKQALRDPLTGMYNRNFFDEAMNKELCRCARQATPLGVIFTDIDKFKNLNDTYGHQFGDEVLKRVAEVLEGSLRKSDVLARFGGEEFVIMAINPTEKGVTNMGERLRQKIEAEEFFFDGQRVPVTISVGVSLAIPDRKETGLGEKLIAKADEAMYKSKQNGRNQVHVHSLLNDEDRRMMQRVMAARFSRWLVKKGVFDIPTISKALLQFETEHVYIGELARQQHILTEEQVEEILRDQGQSGKRFGAIGIRLGYLTEDQVVHLLALQQEDPAELVMAAIRMELLDQQTSAGYLEEYLAAVPKGAPA